MFPLSCQKLSSLYGAEQGACAFLKFQGLDARGHKSNQLMIEHPRRMATVRVKVATVSCQMATVGVNLATVPAQMATVVMNLATDPAQMPTHAQILEVILIKAMIKCIERY